jgi:hypothetical protein
MQASTSSNKIILTIERSSPTWHVIANEVKQPFPHLRSSELTSIGLLLAAEFSHSNPQSASHWVELRPNSGVSQNNRMFLSRALLCTSLLRSRSVVSSTKLRRNMGSVSAIDSAIFRSLFGTDEIREVRIHPTLKARQDDD